jgi:tight adherence protein B
MLAILLFVTLFTTVAVLLLLVSSGKSTETQQAIARLDAIGIGPSASLADEEPLAIRREEVLSGIPWLDRVLQRLDLARKLRLLLYQAEVDWTPGRFILTGAIIALVCGTLVYLRTESGLLMLVMMAAGGSAPLLWVRRKRSKRFDKLKERLPEALDLMVSAIRAGHSFSSAMGMVAKECPEPVKREFRQCWDEQNYGLDLRVAMSNTAYRAPIREIRMITAAVLIQKETGGNLTEILEKVAQLIREDFRLQRQVQVHTAQGRLTGWILSLLPVFLGIALYIVNPEHMSLLWRREFGVHMLEGSVVMTTIGILIIRRIIRIEM